MHRGIAGIMSAIISALQGFIPAQSLYAASDGQRFTFLVFALMLVSRLAPTSLLPEAILISDDFALRLIDR